MKSKPKQTQQRLPRLNKAPRRFLVIVMRGLREMVIEGDDRSTGASEEADLCWFSIPRVICSCEVCPSQQFSVEEMACHLDL